VIISTPNKTHFSYCKLALDRGKHGESGPAPSRSCCPSVRCSPLH
jgi:hypothetical protein